MYTYSAQYFLSDLNQNLFSEGNCSM